MVEVWGRGIPGHEGRGQRGNKEGPEERKSKAVQHHQAGRSVTGKQAIVCHCASCRMSTERLTEPRRKCSGAEGGVEKGTDLSPLPPLSPWSRLMLLSCVSQTLQVAAGESGPQGLGWVRLGAGAAVAPGGRGSRAAGRGGTVAREEGGAWQPQQALTRVQ